MAWRGRPRWRMRWLLWWRRWFLWLLLGVLVLLMLATLIWLAGRYEASQVQDRLERDASEAVADIRNTLARNAQSLQALQAEIATGIPLGEAELRGEEVAIDR